MIREYQYSSNCHARYFSGYLPKDRFVDFLFIHSRTKCWVWDFIFQYTVYGPVWDCNRLYTYIWFELISVWFSSVQTSKKTWGTSGICGGKTDMPVSPNKAIKNNLLLWVSGLLLYMMNVTPTVKILQKWLKAQWRFNRYIYSPAL